MIDEAATAGMHEAVPFAASLGIEVLRNSPSEVSGRVAWTPTLCTVGGALNGGVIMALADNTGALVAFLNLPEGSSGTTTIESKTNFMRAVRGWHITAVSRPLHVGRRIVVVETDVRDDEDRLVARSHRVRRCSDTPFVLVQSGDMVGPKSVWSAACRTPGGAS